VVRERKGADHTLAALKSIRAARPGGCRLFVIMDNLSANKIPAIRRWARRENVELCFTPTSASWANPIEAQFGPLRTFVMGGSDHPNHTVLARKLQDYLRWRNAHALCRAKTRTLVLSWCFCARQAALWYSLIKPWTTCLRLIRAVTSTASPGSCSGGLCSRDW
jgi:hypothetical protein